jgi:hypothetical protein
MQGAADTFTRTVNPLSIVGESNAWKPSIKNINRGETQQSVPCNVVMQNDES